MCSNGLGNPLRDSCPKKTLCFHSLRRKSATRLSSETQWGLPEFPTTEAFEETLGKILCYTSRDWERHKDSHDFWCPVMLFPGYPQSVQSWRTQVTSQAFLQSSYVAGSPWLKIFTTLWLLTFWISLVVSSLQPSRTSLLPQDTASLTHSVTVHSSCFQFGFSWGNSRFTFTGL